MNSFSPPTYLGQCNIMNFAIITIQGDQGKDLRGVLITLGKVSKTNGTHTYTNMTPTLPTFTSIIVL
jgi:hypothetical protein